MKRLIIVTVIIGIASVVGTIIIGSLSFEGTVEKDPYSAALHWDAAHREQELSGWNVTVTVRSIPPSEGILSVHLTDAAGRNLNNARIAVHLTLPSSNRHDGYYHLNQTAAGVYTADVHFPVRGEWIARILVSLNGKSIEFIKRFPVG